MRKSGRWLLCLDFFFFFPSFLPIQFGENTGRASFLKDNGGKSHSENTGRQLQGSVSKDTGRKLCISSSSPVTLAHRQEAGKEV